MSGGAGEALSGPNVIVTASCYAVLAATVLATIVLVGQPVYANDSWIHLALGRAFLSMGPWLEADPFLFAAPGPPAPSAWLASSCLFLVQDTLGFMGLRVLHVLIVAGLLALVFAISRRATGSGVWAALVTTGFVALSTFRLVQLRPELFSIGASLLLFAILAGGEDRGPGLRGILAIGLLTAVWANLHAAFVLAPILLGGSAIAISALSFWPDRAKAVIDRARARRMGAAACAATLAGLVNPQGVAAYGVFAAAGGETLALQSVVDEWAPTDPFALPAPLLPPTWASWLIFWLCLVSVATALVRLLRVRASAAREEAVPDPVDPLLLAWAAAGLFAAMFAARFLWLCVFALILLGQLVVARRRRSPLWRGTIALGMLVIAGLHFIVGDWPLVSRALRRDFASYAEPYRAAKYFGHAMWFLADTRVEGRIFNDYPLGGFMSFWHWPRLSMSSSGTLNVERSAMKDFLAIESHGLPHASVDVSALLDAYEIDLFLGTGLPVQPTSARPISTTVRHLEDHPDWILVFRSLRSAVYLRRPTGVRQAADRRRASNLERIAAYYRRARVPFDVRLGFDAAAAIESAKGWAIGHGLVPRDVAAIRAAAEREGGSGPASDRMAELYAVLGRYEESLAFDSKALRSGGLLDGIVAQRAIWSSLQRGRLDAAAQIAVRLDDASRRAGAGGWRDLVSALSAMPPRAQRAEIHLLPLFDPARGRLLQRGVLPPRARTVRPGRDALAHGPERGGDPAGAGVDQSSVIR